MFKLLVILFTKENFADNHVHNVLRLFNGWANLSFTTNETWKVKPPKAYHFRKFGNIFKISKLHIMVAYCLFFLPKWKFFSTSKNLLKKQKLNFSRSGPFHMETRVCLKHFVSDFLFKFYFLDKFCNSKVFNRTLT